MNIISIVGARPQFIKASPVSKCLRRSGHNEFLVHTGQHYDTFMSDIFFRDLDIPKPYINLNIGSNTHGRQTASMLMEIEDILISKKPDIVLIYGDTNSTLAGALASVKLHIPLAHVEAGLRSFNKLMPEEHNRIVADHLSNILFCPSQTAVQNLSNEGIKNGVHLTGDVMYDALLQNLETSKKRSDILNRLSLKKKKYMLATVHRAENTDNKKRLTSIFHALENISQNLYPVVLPLHPRTKKLLQKYQITISKISIIDPVSYLDMLLLEKESRMILTDSGGVQKEAYWVRVPCITMRDETEWIETVDSNWNLIAGANSDIIYEAAKNEMAGNENSYEYGDANASDKINTIIENYPDLGQPDVFEKV